MMTSHKSNLLPVQDALELLLAAFDPVETEKIPTRESRGRVLAGDVHSDLELPPFSNSSMDGFAVRAADVSAATPDNPVQLDVTGDIPAGAPINKHLHAGEAMRIMTGAPAPAGADAVVPVEDTDIGVRDAGAELPESIQVYRAFKDGDYIRRKGEDLAFGETVLHRGDRLRARDLGMLATLGVAQIKVFRKPTVAILSTGDELVDVEAPLGPGKIRESNSFTLAAQVESCGADVVSVNRVADNPEAIRGRLDAAVEAGVDLIISTAGVSVGAFDFVRSVVEADGTLDFWRVDMRPGKPITFGNYKQVRFVGLPGNPVSAFVGFEVFLRPALHRLAGVPGWVRKSMQARIRERTHSDGRESYLRGIIQEDANEIVVTSASHQGSGNLFSLVKANCLYIIPAGVRKLEAGAEVTFWPLDQ